MGAEVSQDMNQNYRIKKKRIKMTNIMAIVAALILVESGGDPNEVGKCGGRGVLQITPIMYREYKRLGGTLPPEAVWCPMKAKQMAHRVLEHRMRDGYDPVSEACRIWNPKAGKWYEKRVREVM